MWVTVSMIKSKETADAIQSLLSREGILVKSRQVYKNVSEDSNYYEIRVLKSEAEEARNILLENGF